MLPDPILFYSIYRLAWLHLLATDLRHYVEVQAHCLNVIYILYD